MAPERQESSAITTPPALGPKRPRRAARPIGWVLRGLALLAALLALLVTATWGLATHLDQPGIKALLLALVKDRTGLGLDYEGLELSLPLGLRARRLRVLAPERFAAHADTFLRVEDLQLDADPWDVARGEWRLRLLRAGRVELAVVRDESGATTLSELAAPRRPAAQAEATRLSHALSKLPRAELASLSVGALGVRWVEIERGERARTLELSGVNLSGVARSGAQGLEGTELLLRGAALGVALSEPARVVRAELSLEGRVRGVGADMLAFELRAALGDRAPAPRWASRGELLELAGSARFDAPRGETEIEIGRARALDGAYSLAGHVRVLDAGGLRVVTNGTAVIHIDELPVEVPGLALDGLVLELEARELSWDGARVSGTVTASGQARGVELGSAEGSLRSSDLVLSAQGSFDPPRGDLRGTLAAAGLALRSARGSLELGSLMLDLDGDTLDEEGVQRLSAGAVLEAPSARATVREGATTALDGVRLQARLSASSAELAAGSARELESELRVARITRQSRGLQVVLERMAATARVRGLTRDANAALGVRGVAELALSVPSLRAFHGSGLALRRTARRESVSLEELELRAALPLSLASATGTLSGAALRAGPRALRGLGLELDLSDPLAWSGARAGAPRATLRGHVDRFDLGGGRGSVEALRVSAARPEPDRYQLELSATGAALRAGGVPLPGRLRAEARAEAAPAAGTLRLSTALAGERDARLELEIDAGFERASERLGYRAALSAQRLGAFAAFVSQLVPSAAPLSLESVRLRAAASGELEGVLRAAAGPVPALAEGPLAMARGSQRLQLGLAGIDYRGASRSLVIPEIAIELGSVHGAAGAGSVSATWSAPSIELGGEGSSVRLKGLRQDLLGVFDRSPDEGTIDLRSTLALDVLGQSWLPEYPMRDVRLSSRLSIERLRSISLLDLELENLIGGTVLRAKGALELHPRATRGRETIAGRQALALEGRLEQRLAPLEALGIAARARGTLAVPFRLESGGLLAYRLLATLEARDVAFVNRKRAFAVQGLNGAVPLIEEFVLLPTGPELSAGPRTSPLADPRFFDVHPFVTNNSYLTADAITIGRLQTFGPIAANVRVDRTDFLIDQLQAGFRGGQVTGRVHVAYRQGDPIARLRLNATGVRTQTGGEVLDANMALTFVPAAMTLDGKVQLVRASRAHVMDILDVLDPYHELVTANRVRRALALGYPRFVRFQLHDGTVDGKIELGGLAQLVRIDEIRAVPLGPILERYVAPASSALLVPKTRAAAELERATQPSERLP